MPFFDKYPYTNFHNINLDWVLQRVKEWGELVEQNNIAFHNLEEANENFKEYVTNYLQNLDVQEEINNKLDDMLESGILLTYMQPYISNATSSWLSENITQPVGVVIDNSLTVAGACADAKAVGDILRELEESLEYQAIPTNSDLNNYYDNGKYYIGSNSVIVDNFPLSNIQACLIDVNPLSNGLVSQIITIIGTGAIYTRWRLANGNWGSWHNFTDSELNKSVRFDISQTKTEVEKATARANIGVSDSAGLSERAQYMLLRCLRDTASITENGKFYVDSFAYALDDSLQFVYGLGFTTTTLDGQEVTYVYSFSNVTRIGMFSNEPINAPFNKFNANQNNIKAYPIPVPEGATTLVLTKPAELCGVMTVCTWDSTNNVWLRKRGFAGENTNYNTDMTADVSGINDGNYYIVYTFVSNNPSTGVVTDLKTIDLTTLDYEFT